MPKIVDIVGRLLPVRYDNDDDDDNPCVSARIRAYIGA